MTQFDDFTLRLLTNEPYLRMYRTVHGAREFSRQEKNGRGTILWVAEGDDCKYIGAFNTDSRTRRIRVPLERIAMPDTAYALYDVWADKMIGVYSNTASVTVAPHGAALLRFE